jgi:hypothetical protein
MQATAEQSLRVESPSITSSSHSTRPTRRINPSPRWSISIWISVSSAGEQRPTKSAKNGSSHSPEVGGGNPCVQENARGRRWAVLPCQVGMRAFQWTGSTSISGFGAPRRRLSCRSLPADYGTRIGASGRLSAMRLVDVAAAGGWKDKATLLEC